VRELTGGYLRRMATPERLAQLLDPAHTTVVTMELQKGVVGAEALLPAMPEAVREAGILPVAGRVCGAARAHGVRVVHATMRERPDGAGQAVNCKIFAIGAKRRAAVGYSPTDIGQPGVELVDELDRQPADIEVPRMHGMTPFTGTELDMVLRNLGTHTVVLMGVSLNLGIIGAALSALDLGYQVVVVSDAVAGLPKEYAAQVVAHSLSMIATMVTADEVLSAWNA
jgi:nicotinamidase-related amidase